MNDSENIIFIISQPRAGSTLIQRILGTHPDIHTQSEPWVLLNPLCALKPSLSNSRFDSDMYAEALTGFINSLPAGLNEYITVIGKAYFDLYISILRKHNKKLFLDKTPRYYHIIDELQNYFPQAKFIFLLRNPVAVLVSMAKTWIKGNWFYLSEYRYDLLDAPELIVKGITKLGDNACVLNYEDFIKDPETQLTTLFKYLEVDYFDWTQYNNSPSTGWRFGDKGSAFNKNMPDPGHINEWLNSLNDPQLFRVVEEYISYLGPGTFDMMGYSYEEIIKLVNTNKPDIDIGRYSVGIDSLLQNSREVLIENKRLKALIDQRDEKIRKLESLLGNARKL